MLLGLLALLTAAWALVFVRFENMPSLYDAYAWQSVPEANNGGSNNFQIMSYDRPPYNMRGYIQFNTSTIPQGSLILSATMRLRVWSKSEPDASKNVGDPTGRQYGAFPMMASWEEYGINWSNQPTYDENQHAVSSVPAGQGGWGDGRPELWMDWDIRQIVTEWVNDKSNYGLLIRDLNEDSNVLYSTQFFTHDQVPGPEYYPRLVVVYVEPFGVAFFVLLVLVWTLVIAQSARTRIREHAVGSYLKT
jgi:hypothetical protein